MSIFDKRAAFKPFDYPDIVGFRKGIEETKWTFEEWYFTSDSHEFRTLLDHRERETIRRALLAISQVEVSVKKFWAKVGDRFPKPEIEQVGITFGFSEVRHANAYSHLLEVLGLNCDFAKALQTPALKARQDYLQACIAVSPTLSHEEFVQILSTFTLFVENVSLFSQFLIIQALHRATTYLKDVENVIQATRQEENLHALFGAWLVARVKEEHPEWFGDSFKRTVYAATEDTFRAECDMVNWMFEGGDLPWLSADTVKEFVKLRLNNSLALIDLPPLFSTNKKALDKVSWFKGDLKGNANTDFFYKQPVGYTKDARSCTAEDLF